MMMAMIPGNEYHSVWRMPELNSEHMLKSGLMQLHDYVNSRNIENIFKMKYQKYP